MKSLENKVAIVTGSGAGIGRAIAFLFAEEGAKVVVASIGAEHGEETVEMIRKSSGEAVFVQVDVSKTSDIKRMVETTVDKYGKLDILCNNAGIQGSVAKTADLSEEDYDRVMAVNLRGVWLGMKYVIPEMIKVGGGSIVNMASMSGAMVAMKGAPHYGATKGGVVAISRVTALEYVKQNIRVNCVNPGPILTPLVQAVEEEKPGHLDRLANAVPMGRLGTMEEVANAVLFLVSDKASFITGTQLVIDGGLTASCLVHMTD